MAEPTISSLIPCRRQGVETRFASFEDHAGLEALIDENTPKHFFVKPSATLRAMSLI